MTGLSATARTLATTELLELILSYLPHRTLLLAQRINKTFYSLISTSPTLQSRLYFRASISPTPPFSDHTINPLLESAFPFLLTPRKILSEEEAADWDLKFGHLKDAPDPGPSLVHVPKAFQYSSWATNPEAWNRAEASWRRMFVTDPPVKRVVFRSSSSGMMGIVVSEVVVKIGEENGEVINDKGETQKVSVKVGEQEVDLAAEDGLRMGLLYDYLFKRICTGDWPSSLEMEFTSNYPTEDDLKLFDAPLDAEMEQDGIMTAIVTLGWSHGCVVTGPDPSFPQFRSDGYQRVEVEPWKVISSKMWD